MSSSTPGSGSMLAGRYRLVEPLGSGGMGTVWRAHDELLDRVVAIKEVQLPAWLDDEARDMVRRRTMREARAAARLRHTGIVMIFDVIEQDSRPWIVMELVEAPSLAQVLRERGSLPPLRVASIAMQVLDAMVTAQAGGVAHRDIKPANVLISDKGRVVLTDFGIARQAGDETLTGAGLLLGSPDFLAPERARGHDSPGLAADLWSLGAMMYAAVEGRRPFERDGPLPTLTAVVMDEPDPPRRAGPLRPIIDRLLVKDPAHRMDAETTRRMLERVVRGRVSTAPPPPAGRRAGPAAPAAPGGLTAGRRAGPAEPAAPAGGPTAGRRAGPAEPGAPGAPGVPGPAAAAASAGTAAGAEAIGDGGRAAPGTAASAKSADPGAEPHAAAATATGAAPKPADPGAAGPHAAATATGTAAGAEAVEGGGERAATRTDAPRQAAAGAAGAAVAAGTAAGAEAGEGGERADARTEAPGQAAAGGVAIEGGGRADAPEAAGAGAAARPTAAVTSTGATAPARAAEPGDASGGGPGRRRVLVLVGLVVLALVAGLAALVIPKVTGDPARPGAAPVPSAPATERANSTPATTSPTTPATSPPTSSAPRPTANRTPTRAANTTPPTGAAVPVPAGFTRYTDPQDAFSLIVPSGWRPVRNGTLVDFRDPGSARFLRIDTSDTPLPDPYTNWIAYEAQFRQGKTGYRNLGIRRVPSYRPAEGWSTADWEFLLGGTHVLDRNIRVSDVRAHAIYWSTPTGQWATAQSRRVFQLAAASFVPSPAGR